MFQTTPISNRRDLGRALHTLLAVGAFLTFGSVLVADLNPAAITITLPKDIHWVETAASATAIMAGDPSKPGIYVEFMRWKAGNMSRPHYHPNDRYIHVISGTWWVGTGTKYDPASTVPVPTGSFVKHDAKGIHYDGAKDADCLLEIVGMGPATSVPAEVK